MKSDYNYYLLTFCKTFIFALATFLTPIKGLLILAGMSVFLDTIFAIYTTIKLNGWASYQSTKLFNIVVKTFFYFGSIILGYFIDTHVIENNTLFGVNLLIAKTVTLFWLYIEVKSIDETSQKLGNKPFYNIIKNLLQKLKSLKQDINEIKKD
jgi:phage-related holin